MCYLAHEAGDDTVEAGALVAEALLTSAQGTEVLSSLGHNVRPELWKHKSSSICSSTVKMLKSPKKPAI